MTVCLFLLSCCPRLFFFSKLQSLGSLNRIISYFEGLGGAVAAFSCMLWFFWKQVIRNHLEIPLVVQNALQLENHLP